MIPASKSRCFDWSCQAFLGHRCVVCSLFGDLSALWLSSKLGQRLIVACMGPQQRTTLYGYRRKAFVVCYEQPCPRQMSLAWFGALCFSYSAQVASCAQALIPFLQQITVELCIARPLRCMRRASSHQPPPIYTTTAFPILGLTAVGSLATQLAGVLAEIRGLKATESLKSGLALFYMMNSLPRLQTSTRELFLHIQS